MAETLAETPFFEFSTDKILQSRTGPMTTTIQPTCATSKSSAIPTVRIKPGNHQDYAWVSRRRSDELRGDVWNERCSAGMTRWHNDCYLTCTHLFLGLECVD